MGISARRTSVLSSLLLLLPARSLTVARDLCLEAGGHPHLWPYHGALPVLVEDASGKRLTFTGVPQDWEGAWSHAIEVS